ncbi:T9SS type A sorting domain-containing protein [Candidatus Poribacteria bacterium]|nr:T9SS type A sorting domain-containing protein [Candidatus Poribacteria bacterium]
MKRRLSLLLLILFFILSQGIAFSSPIDVRQGEQVTLTLKLVNVEGVALSNVKAFFSNAPEWISPSVSPVVSLEAKGVGNERPVALLPFTFTVDKYAAPEGVSYPLTLKISDASNGVWTKEIVLNVLSRPLPKSSALLQNYPNPFNPETWIPYQLKEASDVTIRIFDLRGQLVRTLDLGYKEADFYVSRSDAAYWDGRNNFGERVASGIYFYQLQAGSFSALKKMLILK